MRSSWSSGCAPNARRGKHKTSITPRAHAPGAFGRLSILRLIGGHAQIKGPLSPLAVWGQPDRLETLLGLRLEALRQLVALVGRLRHPTPLPTRRSIPLAQRFPNPQRPLPNGQGWPVLSHPCLWRSSPSAFQACSLSREPSQRPTRACWPLASAPIRTRRPGRDSARRVSQETPPTQQETERLPCMLRLCHGVSASCQPCVSRLSVAGESPGASGPKRAWNAAEQSPVETPVRHSQGHSASRLCARRL